MYRLIHNQTTMGPIRIDDIDDGLPNKTAHRLGSTANPDAYERDGYANKPKQPCYVPYWKPGSTTIPGYIDLRETQRVELSAGKGKIFKFQQAAYVTVVTFAMSDLTAPAVTAANLGVPGPGDLTITGTNMLSIQPEVTSVVITGTGAVTLTQAQIIAGGGTVTDISIVIPAVLVPGIAAVTSFVEVLADAQSSGAPVAVA